MHPGGAGGGKDDRAPEAVGNPMRTSATNDSTRLPTVNGLIESTTQPAHGLVFILSTDACCEASGGQCHFARSSSEIDGSTGQSFHVPSTFLYCVP